MTLSDEIKEFNIACDEIANGKYILVDIKLNKLLSLIDSSTSLSKIISNSTNNYDFDKNLQSMLSKYFAINVQLPESTTEMIAFTYNLIQKLCDKEIDFHDFVERFFQDIEHTSNNEFVCFVENIIIPFQKAVNSVAQNMLIESAKNQLEVSIYSNLIEKIHMIAGLMDSFKLNQLEKDEFNTLLNSLYISCKNGDKKFVYSFMIAIDYFTKCHKKSRQAYNMLKEAFEN